MKDPGRGWPTAASRVGQVILHLGDGGGEDPKHNLSAGTRVGNSLFIAGDEMATIEHLAPDADGRWSRRGRYPLANLLDLRDPDEEADIEGLSADDGWLWVVGSHARTRRKPDKAADLRTDLETLADLKDTRPRCLLARLPLVAEGEDPTVVVPVRVDGERRAGLVRQTKRGSKLSDMLRADPLLAPFTRIPAKEGGVDIEGVATVGNRVALGMRGPVIRNFAALLELTIGSGASGRLKIDGPATTRLLDLEGLGIRDLKRRGDDLLILAGPTTSLSGPCALYAWRNWINDPPKGNMDVALHRPERLFDLPFGRGVDHPEGLALWDEVDGADRILVLCDSPSPHRLGKEAATFEADLFEIARERQDARDRDLSG